MKEQDENIDNLLEKAGNKQPFRVPEYYFETLAERIQARIEEEEQPVRKKTLYFYLKPAFSMAASIALVMLLVYVPIKRFFPSSEGYLSQQQSIKDSTGVIPVELITYFSEGQFLSAVSEMNEIETQKLSPDSLADYIAANYNEYEIIANN
jgi:hypothetical protein